MRCFDARSVSLSSRSSALRGQMMRTVAPCSGRGAVFHLQIGAGTLQKRLGDEEAEAEPALAVASSGVRARLVT